MKRTFLSITMVATLFACSEDESILGKTANIEGLLQGTWAPIAFHTSTNTTNITTFSCDVEGLEDDPITHKYRNDRWFLQAQEHTFNKDVYTSVNECYGVNANGSVDYSHVDVDGRLMLNDNNSGYGGFYMITAISKDRVTFESMTKEVTIILARTK